MSGAGKKKRILLVINPVLHAEVKVSEFPEVKFLVQIIQNPRQILRRETQTEEKPQARGRFRFPFLQRIIPDKNGRNGDIILLKNGKKVQSNVETGMETDDNIEITSGVSEGEVVTE